jgi:drug/metabolite transporter (DMT)-like permease
MMHADSRLRADLALVLVALFWGVTFPLIRGALEQLSAVQFVAWRFTLAVVAFLPLLFADPGARRGLRDVLGAGLLLGLISWASYFAQTWGLQTVPAGRAAFITGTNVVLVPLLAPLFGVGRPRWSDFLAAIVATFGLYLMTMGDAGPGAGLSSGDFWILFCAVSYAIYILVLQRVLQKPRNATALAFSQIAAIALFADLMLGLTGPVTFAWSPWVIAALLICATLATVGTFWLQARFQGQTTAQRVALIFALEPVFATGFAWWLLGETMGLGGAAGAVLVLAAVVGAELWSSRVPA